jgi:hypothetical protein
LQEHVESGAVSDISSDAENALALEHTGLVDIPIEVSLIDEPTAKFTGNYSDVHIGRFRNEKVRLLDPALTKHEADGCLQVAVKIIKHISGASLETMQRVGNYRLYGPVLTFA